MPVDKNMSPEEVYETIVKMREKTEEYRKKTEQEMKEKTIKIVEMKKGIEILKGEIKKAEQIGEGKDEKIKSLQDDLNKAVGYLNDANIEKKEIISKIEQYKKQIEEYTKIKTGDVNPEVMGRIYDMLAWNEIGPELNDLNKASDELLKAYEGKPLSESVPYLERLMAAKNCLLAKRKEQRAKYMEKLFEV